MKPSAGTRETFLKLIDQRGIYKKLGYDRSTISLWKKQAKEGKGISLDLMESILLKNGYTVLQEKIWVVPD